MSMLLLLGAIQASAYGPVSAPDQPSAGTSSSNQSCDRSTTEIIVCAHEHHSYDLPKPNPELAPKSLPKAEWRIFGDAKMDMHFAPRSSGVPAFMVTVTKPF